MNFSSVRIFITPKQQQHRVDVEFIAHTLISMVAYVIWSHFACKGTLVFQNSKNHSGACHVPSLEPTVPPRWEAVIFQSVFLAHFFISMISYVILTHFACIITLVFQNSTHHYVARPGHSLEPTVPPRWEAVIFQSVFLAHFLISMLSYVILTHFACIIALGFQNSKIHSVACHVPSL